MEQRHRHEQAVAVGERQHGEHVLGMGEQVAVRQLDALGPAGGAGAVEQQRGGLRRDVGQGRRSGGREPRFELVVLPADDDDLLHGGQPRPQRRDLLRELRSHEQDPRPRVVDHVVEFVPGEPEVRDRVGRAERGRGVGDLEAGEVVLVDERDGVGRPDPLRGEGAGEVEQPLVPLRPGVGAVEVLHRDLVRLGLRPVRDAVEDDGRSGDGHAGASWKNSCPPCGGCHTGYCRGGAASRNRAYRRRPQRPHCPGRQAATPPASKVEVSQ